MKKLFTSVMAALTLAAPFGTLSAQSTQLTESQKELIKKEVLPVVFEQIKEQAGIDILGWANPQLKTNTLAGIPVLETSSLRAASQDPISVKPDSVVLNANELLKLLPDGSLGDYAGIINTFVGEKLKITFEGYKTTTIPFVSVGGTPITVDLPATINVNGRIPLANIYFTSTTNTGDKLLDVDIDMSVLGGDKMDMLACSLSQDKQTYDLNADIDIQDYLRTLLNEASVPAIDYSVTIGLKDFLLSSKLPATLFAIPEESPATTRIPLGKAVIALNPDNKQMPIKAIDVTGYDKSGKENAWFTFNLSSSVTTSETSKVTTLNVDRLNKNSADDKSPEFAKRTIITASDFTASLPTDAQAAVKSVITRVVNELANDGKATWYQLNIAQTDKEDDQSKEIVNIEVQPYVEGTNAIADVIIKVGNEEYTVKATANLTNQKISVDVVKGETTYGTAYFTSNIAGIVTSNEENIAIETLKVIPTQNGVRISNIDKAAYQIVSISGAVVASGNVSGDTYISTSSLAKGIYLVVVEANGTKQVVKFVR